MAEISRAEKQHANRDHCLDGFREIDKLIIHELFPEEYFHPFPLHSIGNITETLQYSNSIAEFLLAIFP